MQKRAVALAVVVVGASIAALVPAGATGDPAPRAHDAPGIELGAHAPEHEPRAHAPEREVESRSQHQFQALNQAPPDLPEQWQRTYGGDGDDTFADIVRTDDGGYLAVGWTERDDDDDGWAVKVDGDGDQQWSNVLGGDGVDRFRGVVSTDEGYLLAGRTDEGGSSNGWIVEVDSDGEVVRERTPGTGAFYAVVRDDASDSSGDAAGDDANDSSGDAAGNDANDSSEDAGYLLAGHTYGDSGNEGWLLKLDGERSEAWQTSVPAPEEYRSGHLRAVVPTDSGYYLAGKLEGDSDDGWALKVDAAGEREWTTAAGGSDRDDVWAAAPAGPDAERDGFVLAGETESDSDGPRDGWLVAFGPEGDVTWERTPGGEGTQWLDSAMRTDGGFLFTGGSDQGPHGSADGYVLATDDAGEVRSESYYGTGAWDKPWPAIRAHDGGYLLAGKTSGGDGAGEDGWLLRIGESGSDSTAGETSDAADETTTATGASDGAIRGDTPTATDSPGSVPGFGVGAALVALAAALLALRR